MKPRFLCGYSEMAWGAGSQFVTNSNHWILDDFLMRQSKMWILAELASTYIWSKLGFVRLGGIYRIRTHLIGAFREFFSAIMPHAFQCQNSRSDLCILLSNVPTPPRFNGGMFIMEPAESKFQKLRRLLLGCSMIF